MAFGNVYRNFWHVLRADGFVFRGRRKFGLLVINKTGVTIATDKLVAISGYDTTTKLPKIVLADADAVNLATEVWVTNKAIADQKTATVFKGGMSAANLNTNSATSAGDPVFLDTTAGGFTSTQPTLVAARVVIVGYVQVKSATVGQIAWDIQDPSRLGVNDQTNALPLTTYSGDGAISVAPQIAYLTKGSAAAMTLAAPGANGIGTVLTITTGSNFAHVVTFTGTTLNDGTAGANITWTAAAVQGSSITVVGVTAALWNVVSFNLGTIA
jgi:hypothetical protein